MIARALFMLLALCLSGCQQTAHYKNSNIVDFLYPDTSHQAEPTARTGYPDLTTPLNLGIAFTPDIYQERSGLTEQHKVSLLKDIASHFKTLDIIKDIEIIPSGYLKPGGSFANLTQLQQLFGIDVIALVSYDQTYFNDDGASSFAYWTLVGAYVVRGEKNSTYTLLDASLFDIVSQELLFRASGVSSIQSKATVVNLSEKQREDSITGYLAAKNDLIPALKRELSKFRNKYRLEKGMPLLDR